VAKAGRIPDPTERGDAIDRQRIERFFLAAMISQRDRLMGNFNPRRGAGPRRNLVVNLLADFRTDSVGAGQDNDIRTAQSGDRFTQQTSRQQVSIAERLERIDQYQIQIAVDTPMLKGVVQKDQLRIEFFDSGFGRFDSIGILHMWYVGEFLLQLERFVVARSGLGAVAATDDDHTNSVPAKPLDQPLDHRRLASASDRQVTDADHRHTDLVRSASTGVKLPISPGDGQTVGEFRHAEQSSPDRGGETSASSTDKVSKLGGVKQDGRS
jgi:hypothetical protein